MNEIVTDMSQRMTIWHVLGGGEGGGGDLVGTSYIWHSMDVRAK